MVAPKGINVRLDGSAATRTWTPLRDLSPATQVLWCDVRAGVARLRTCRGDEHEWTDPLDALNWLQASLQRSAIGSGARWVGYVSYDLGRLFESLPRSAADDLGLPLFVFTLHGSLEDRTPIELDGLDDLDRTGGRGGLAVRSTFTRDGYVAAVNRALGYIRAGDIFQVNLSQRFTTGLPATPAVIYERLRDRSPAAYGAYLDYGGFALLCNSPELFLRVTPDPTTGRRRVMTRPIKGTRPRAPGMDAELRESAKDQAELNMIIDLERNDLGRVCEVGTVRVTGPRSIEAHPTVYHGVATIEGVLRDDVTFVDLLRATFPGGSITGAPKIRAMEIIEELEPVRRGPYCGAIGYLAADGRMEFNIAIRTMIVNDGLVHVPVGGGIVADSDPAAEYEETLVKTRAMFAALGVFAEALQRTQ